MKSLLSAVILTLVFVLVSASLDWLQGLSPLGVLHVWPLWLLIFVATFVAMSLVARNAANKGPE